MQQATTIQHLAARPDQSVALRASAGSGKTKVLVDRFLRLCIEDKAGPAHPRSVLAITFTRKAAVEIRERLLSRARELALADEDSLHAALTGLFAHREKPTPSARELFAAGNLLEKILEDVSGLNVGTIHSFCQLILGRFAAEAGLDPHFSVLENPDELLDEALESLEAEMARDAGLRTASAGVGKNPLGVRKALHQSMHERMRMGRWLNAHGRRGDSCSAHLPDLLADLKGFLFPDLDLAGDPVESDFLDLLAACLEDFAGPGVTAISTNLGADLKTINPKNLNKLGEEAERIAGELRQLDPEKLDALAFSNLVKEAHSIFLTQKNTAKAYSRLKKDLDLKDHFNRLVCEQSLGVLSVLHRLSYVELYNRNRDLLQLSLRLYDLYDGLKKRDRVVDFQDLEDMACRLMGEPSSVGALLFRLDDSLSHILLDEFQDTNFNQWDMINPFVEEFLAAEGEDHPRTLFFVGDVKQSIYGFRGAEPGIFDHACAQVQEYNLPTNFRSLGNVVGGVGCLFNALPLRDALSDNEREHVRQKWARQESQGTVYVLDPFAPEAAEDGVVPDDGRSADQLAAQAAANWVQRHKNHETSTTWDGFGDDLRERPLRWDDFLILTRSRTEISLYEKAFRDAGIPFVPLGRGMLAASREVQDILALLRWLLWPEDDAALSTVLRSPLFRLSEDSFQELLAARELFRVGDDPEKLLPPRDVWVALKKKGDSGPFERPCRLLKEWRKHLGYDSSHDLLRRVFRDGDVLERYRVARGDQAHYNLERLFDLALSPEISGTPTVRRLVDFISAAAGRGGQDEGTLPRSSGEGRVRFMTIHGAKGLEAPVVMVVDADRASGKESAQVRLQPDAPNTPLMFKVNQSYRNGFALHEGVVWPTDPLQRVSEAARKRGQTEDANLLYVAMTRARDCLVVMGGDRERGANFDSPLRQIQRGIAAGDCDSYFETSDPEGMQRPPLGPEKSVVVTTEDVEDETRTWLPPPSRERVKVINPSGVHAEKTENEPLSFGVTEDDGVDPIERGNQVHLLLQQAADFGAMPSGDSDHHGEARGVFEDEQLAWVFRPADSGRRGISEVPVIHQRTAVNERVVGVIDRLIIGPGRVDVVDYKTNRFGGKVTIHENLVRHYGPQMDTYREVVSALYPDCEVGTWLLFTEPGIPSEQRLQEVVAK